MLFNVSSSDSPTVAETLAEFEQDLERLLDESLTDEQAGIPFWMTRQDCIEQTLTIIDDIQQTLDAGFKRWQDYDEFLRMMRDLVA